MLVAEYDRFVRDSDQFADRTQEERERIATYGLVGEIGSLLSAVKKQLLVEAGSSSWNQSNDEIVEELGDSIWYCFSLSQVLNPKKGYNVLRGDITSLRKELLGKTAKSRRVRKALTAKQRELFIARSANFSSIKKLTLGEYQDIAFLTARTRNQVLLRVCLAILWQLSAELLRRTLPESEREINQTIDDRSENRILEEIAWHLAAVSSLYRLKLDDVAAENMRKVSFRKPRGTASTPLHDEDYPDQQFPRQFSISFLTVGDGRARMYLNGRQLGNELTDNAYEGDGYRFHDVLHLANVAKLGWSPVMRSLLGLKRKRDPKVDEVEDGARAQIVEEAVVKVIHSEGTRLAEQRDPDGKNKPWHLFPTKEDVTFRFLKLINGFVSGLEVRDNKYWEWEDAIITGYDVFYKLCREGQGTVHLDLVDRSLKFEPDVYVDMPGTVVGMGTSAMKRGDYSTTAKRRARREQWDGLSAHESGDVSASDATRIAATKFAVLEAVSMPTSQENLAMLQVRLVKDGVTVKAVGEVQKQMWGRGVISFRTSFLERDDIVGCTALAISDAHDAVK